MMSEEIQDNTEDKPIDSTINEHAIPSWERPSFGTKLAYAAPSFATSVMIAPLSIELKIFYTDVVLVPAGLLALAMAIGRAFDAITDPLMGWITDNTQSRWGRRKPWVPIGVPLSAFCYWLMFIPPEGLTGGSAAVWGGLTFAFYYIFHTIWAVPYHGLGLELTPDYDDRSSVFGIRSFVGGLGVSMSFLLLWYFQASSLFPDERQMLNVLTGFASILMIVMFVIPLFKVKENPDFQGRKSVPLIPGVRRALRNRPFRIILTVVIIGSVTGGMPALLLPYFTKYVLRAEDQWRVIFAAIYTTLGFLSLPFWMMIARRFGKVHAWVISTVLTIIAGIGMFMLTEGEIVKMCALEVLAGFGVGAQMFLGAAILADIIDYDELRTGKRREAQYGAFMSLLPKFISIVSATLPLAILGAAGYDPSVSSIEDIPVFTIRFLYVLLPVIFGSFTILLILRYPITRSVHEAIREGVDRLRRGEEALDPITGRTLSPAKLQAVDEDTGWFLDYFSVKELKSIVAEGTGGLLNRVKTPIMKYSLICICAILLTVFLVWGSMSTSQMDQFRQGMGTLLIIVAGISLTMTIFHFLRIRSAKKMIAEPVDAAIINAHLKAL